MPWARLDDGYFTHRKVVDLSKDAKLLDLASIAYSARELTDGDLKKRDILVIAAAIDIEDPMPVVAELVEAGRWKRTGNATWAIHDYLTYNPSREQVLRERAATAERQARFRAKGSKAAKRAQNRNGVTNGALTAVVTAYPDPDPGPGNESNPDPDPVPNSEPGDARATRGSSEPQSGKTNHEKMPVPRASNSRLTHAGRVPHPERAPCNDALLIRIQGIGGEFDDDNTASSVTRARGLQAAAHIDDGRMANAIKDAHRRTVKRMEDVSLRPLGSPMAYFLGILEKTTKERSLN